MVASVALIATGAVMAGAGVWGINEVRQLNFFTIPVETPCIEGPVRLHLVVNWLLVVVGALMLGQQVYELVASGGKVTL